MLTNSLARLLSTAALSLLSAALAAGTPANTPISNTASLTYLDALNVQRTQPSNVSIVTVRQVYVVSVDPSAPENAIPAGRQFAAAPGTTTRIPYVVVNGGNGSDTFTLTTVQSGTDGFDVTTRLLPDANCDGVGDGAAIDGVPQVLAADATLCVVIEADVPAGTPAGAAARLSLTATSQGNQAVTDTENYAQVTAAATGTLSLSKAASPTTPVAPGGTLTYTVSGTVQNAPAGAVTGVVTVDGTARTGVLIRDVLPAVTFGAVTAASASSGAPTPLYSTDGGVTWSAAASASGVNAVGLLVEGTGAFLPVGSTLTLSFTATIPTGLAAGTTIRNSAVSTLDGNGDGDGADPGETATTPETTSTVAAVTSVAVGPADFPQGGASGSYTLLGASITRAGDTQTLTTPVTAGTDATFRQTLQNTGNAPTSVTLDVTAAPAGWSCTVASISASDTLGTLTNPVTLAAGQTLDFAVRCAVPAGAAGTVNAALTVSATPQGGSADTTTDTVAQVVAAAPAVLGNGDRDPTTPPDQTSVTVSTPPGTPASFPLELRNGGVSPESYDLTSSVNTQFFIDTNCDGTPDGAAITTTPSVPAGSTLCLVAQVTVPAGAAAGTSPATFTATSTADPTRVSSVTDAVQVNAVASGTIAPDGAQSTVAGGSVTYAHTLTNTSNGAVTYTVAPYTSAQGFTYTYATNPNGPFSATLTGTLAAGASTPVYVRVNVPAGVTGTPSEAATLTVTLSAQDAPQPTATAQVTDTTSVQTVQANLVKSVLRCPDVACAAPAAIPGDLVSPDDILRYTLLAQNTGTSVLSNVTILDAVPANTTFLSVAAAPGVLFSVDGGATWTATAPTSLPTGEFLAGLDSDANGRIDAADTLAPGGSFQVTFTVQVN